MFSNMKPAQKLPYELMDTYNRRNEHVLDNLKLVIDKQQPEGQAAHLRDCNSRSESRNSYLRQLLSPQPTVKPKFVYDPIGLLISSKEVQPRVTGFPLAHAGTQIQTATLASPTTGKSTTSRIASRIDPFHVDCHKPCLKGELQIQRLRS